MSARLKSERALCDMTVAELERVLALENAVYEFPWSHGNFIDSLASGYPSQVLIGPDGALLGYFVVMEGVDEMHLLNLAVAPAEQGRGHARFMLGGLLQLCRAYGAGKLWLEVRESNARARALYERYGFRHIGLRKGYYPAAHGRREHAAVMSIEVAAAVPDAQAWRHDGLV